MRKALLISLMLCCPVLSLAAEPSDASIKSLLAASSLPAAIEALAASSGQYARSVVGEASKGAEVSDAQKKELDAIVEKFSTKVKEEMAYAKVEPQYAAIYKENFSQEEVDGLTVFFKSPAGQAYLKKFPQVLQKSQEVNRGLMVPMMKQLQADIGAVLQKK